MMQLLSVHYRMQSESNGYRSREFNKDVMDGNNFVAKISFEESTFYRRIKR